MKSAIHYPRETEDFESSVTEELELDNEFNDEELDDDELDDDDGGGRYISGSKA